MGIAASASTISLGTYYKRVLPTAANKKTNPTKVQGRYLRFQYRPCTLVVDKAIHVLILPILLEKSLPKNKAPFFKGRFDTDPLAYNPKRAHEAARLLHTTRNWNPTELPHFLVSEAREIIQFCFADERTNLSNLAFEVLGYYEDELKESAILGKAETAISKEIADLATAEIKRRLPQISAYNDSYLKRHYDDESEDQSSSVA